MGGPPQAHGRGRGEARPHRDARRRRLRRRGVFAGYARRRALVGLLRALLGALLPRLTLFEASPVFLYVSPRAHLSLYCLSSLCLALLTACPGCELGGGDGVVREQAVRTRAGGASGPAARG